MVIRGGCKRNEDNPACNGKEGHDKANEAKIPASRSLACGIFFCFSTFQRVEEDHVSGLRRQRSSPMLGALRHFLFTLLLAVGF